MKLLAYIKITLKEILKELPAFVLSYAIYPIVIALLMGFIQKDMFLPKINEPIIIISVLDEDKTPESQDLLLFLESKEISKIVTLKTDDEYDYKLIIPNGYSKSLMGEDTSQLEIIASEKSSSTLGNVLKNILDRYNLEMSQSIIIRNRIDSKYLSSYEREEAIKDINLKLDKVFNEKLFNHKIHQVRKALNSYEYFSITFISFSFIIFIMAVIGSNALEKEKGIYNRIMSTPMNRLEYYNLGLASNYVTMIIVSLIYVSIFRISGLSFKGSIPILFAIILVQSLMITIIGTLITSIFNKKIAMAIAQIYLIFQATLGGMVGPLDKLTNSQIFKFFAKYKPDILITNSYKNYLLYNNFSSISIYLLLMIIISIALYAINIWTIKMNWGVTK